MVYLFVKCPACHISEGASLYVIYAFPSFIVLKVTSVLEFGGLNSKLSFNFHIVFCGSRFSWFSYSSRCLTLRIFVVPSCSLVFTVMLIV